MSVCMCGDDKYKSRNIGLYIDLLEEEDVMVCVIAEATRDYTSLFVLCDIYVNEHSESIGQSIGLNYILRCHYYCQFKYKYKYTN